MDIIIRKAKCKDIPDIISINKASLPVIYSKEEWIHIIIYHTTFIALLNNKVISYISTWKEKYPYPPYKKAHIITFATLPKYRSQGIGGKLLQYTINYWNNLPITLNVMCSNKKAIKFYLKHGFIQYKKLNNYYGKNKHGLQLIINK